MAFDLTEEIIEVNRIVLFKCISDKFINSNFQVEMLDAYKIVYISNPEIN